MDGWKKSFSRLGVYRRGHRLYDCLRRIFYSSQNLENVRVPFTRAYQTQNDSF